MARDLERAPDEVDPFHDYPVWLHPGGYTPTCKACIMAAAARDRRVT
jgi:hypothetical protein